ncbi:3198_t:CDS:2 [Diversispora eburnea]|uniref:3198_t:CDS:1 n=1 Tax=Diversispora eburnea TaxID=1213867 RepID=A0A9N8VTC8_9GLOM|nr:3198_t:CDS:2 [Diversispora eburnea]
MLFNSLLLALNRVVESCIPHKNYQEFKEDSDNNSNNDDSDTIYLLDEKETIFDQETITNKDKKQNHGNKKNIYNNNRKNPKPKRSNSNLFKLSTKWDFSTPSVNSSIISVSSIVTPPSPNAVSAPLWKEQVDPNIKAELSQEEIHRQEIIFEIIRTECDFANDIRYLIEQFRCIQAIMYPVVPSITHILRDLAKQFSIYESYLIHYKAAISEIAYSKKKKNKLGQLVKSLESNVPPSGSCRYLTIESLLTKPFQRLCKYPLLTLLKVTPSGHEDFNSLRDLHDQIDCALNELQERKYEYERKFKNDTKNIHTHNINVLELYHS